MFVRLSAHALYSWNRRSISADEVSLRSFPAAFIRFVSMCLVCDHFLQVSTQAEETLQTLRCEMSSDFPLHNGESLSQFQFHSCFCFPTKLGHPFFLKGLSNPQAQPQPRKSIHPHPLVPPQRGAIPLLLWRRPKVGRKSSWSERRKALEHNNHSQRPWPRAFPLVGWIRILPGRNGGNS